MELEQEEIDRLWMELEKASNYLRNGGHGRCMSEGGYSAEVKYAKLYQKLVRAGQAPQIKKKYRLGI